mgnify:CR=1 FL=1
MLIRQSGILVGLMCFKLNIILFFFISKGSRIYLQIPNPNQRKRITKHGILGNFIISENELKHLRT